MHLASSFPETEVVSWGYKRQRGQRFLSLGYLQKDLLKVSTMARLQFLHGSQGNQLAVVDNAQPVAERSATSRTWGGKGTILPALACSPKDLFQRVRLFGIEAHHGLVEDPALPDPRAGRR